MKIEEFVSGVYKQQYKYKSFSPPKVNYEWVWENGTINTLLEDAGRKLGAFDAFTTYIPDIEIYIKMHITKEAAKSSMIEGTKTEIDDAVRKESEISTEKKDDWQEVQNYIEAMNKALDSLKQLPLSTRMLKDMHRILMKGVRGEHKNPGDYRTSQNWIGGATLTDAAFIPPVHTEINELMGDLEKFIHNVKIQVPILIKAAIAHYQFETIHPFLDGNGRIGRLLIILLLVDKGMLQRPALYLSDYFERHRSLYIENLTKAREYNKLDQWIKFFLTGIIETSDKGLETFRSILKLKDEIEGKRIINLGKRLPNARKLLRHLFKYPIVSANEIKESLNVTLPTANSLIADFERLAILRERTGWKRNREFEFTEYLNLFK
jgi:Fic family protein